MSYLSEYFCLVLHHVFYVNIEIAVGKQFDLRGHELKYIFL